MTIDPLGQPKVTVGRVHCFISDLLSIRPHFSNLEKKTKMFATGVTISLAEWIIDDTCLVYIIHLSSFILGFAIPDLTNQAVNTVEETIDLLKQVFQILLNMYCTMNVTFSRILISFTIAESLYTLLVKFVFWWFSGR